MNKENIVLSVPNPNECKPPVKKERGINMKNTVTQEQIDAIIESSEKKVFHRVFDKQCVVVIKLSNGFTVVGESACVDPSNYDEQIGYDIAIKSIEKRLWELEGYVLQTKLQGE